MSSNSFRYGTVMLIDDNELDNFINRRLIADNSFAERVYVHSSAKSALESIANLDALGKEFKGIFPEVIFIDINMPVMDGFAFIEYFKEQADAHLRMPKLVILTSSVNAKDKLLALESSESILFLNKPLTPDMLEQI